MSWYIHPSKQLRDDELPPELVVTNRDGSIEQVYVPYNASDQLEAENAKLREVIAKWERLASGIDLPEYPVTQFKPKDLERENAMLRETLKGLMMGTNAELCADRGEFDCKECSMHHDEDGCIVVDAIKLLGIDVYGEPLETEVEL